MLIADNGANYVLSGDWMPSQAEIFTVLNNWFEEVSEGFIRGAIYDKARTAVSKLGGWMVDDLMAKRPMVGSFLAAVLEHAHFVMGETMITDFKLFPADNAFVEVVSHYTFSVQGEDTDGARLSLASQQTAKIDVGASGKESFTAFVSSGSRFSLSGMVKIRITNNKEALNLVRVGGGGNRCLLTLTVLASDSVPTLEYKESELTFEGGDRLSFSDAIEDVINDATHTAMTHFYGEDGILISALRDAVGAAADRFAEEMIGTSSHWCRGEVHLQPPSPPPWPPAPPSMPPSPPPPESPPPPLPPPPLPPPSFPPSGARACASDVCGGDWGSSFDHPGTSKCNPGCAVRGLARSDCEELYCLEGATCCELPTGRTSTWGSTSWQAIRNGQGWTKCPDGYYVAGMERSSSNGLDGLRALICAWLPAGAKISDYWDYNVGSIFDHRVDRGESTCRHSSGLPGVMTGIYKSGDGGLYNIETLRCGLVMPGERSTSADNGMTLGIAQLDDSRSADNVALALQTREVALRTPKGRQLLVAPAAHIWGWIKDKVVKGLKKARQYVEKAVDFVKNEVIPAISHYAQQLAKCAKDAVNDVSSGKTKVACEVAVMPAHLEAALQAHKSVLQHKMAYAFTDGIYDYWTKSHRADNGRGELMPAKPNLARLLRSLEHSWKVKDMKGGAAVSFSVDTKDLDESSAEQNGDLEFALEGSLTMPLRVEQNMHVGPWIKMDCPEVNGTLQCPAKLQPPEAAPAGAPALQALKSGVVVSCNPTFTYEATVKYKAEVSNVGFNEVCVKTRPNYVTLTVTSEAEGLTSVSTSESKIDWLDLLSDRIADVLYDLFDDIFDTGSPMTRAISLAIENSLQAVMNSTTGKQCGEK